MKFSLAAKDDISRFTKYPNAFSNIEHTVFWHKQKSLYKLNRPPLTRDATFDLCIIGGGYTGLWTAILAKQMNPLIRIAVLEAQEIGDGASGRNGGFLQHSLTHGINQGESRFAPELATLEKLGLANFKEIEEFILKHRLECDFERVGAIDLAKTNSQVQQLQKTFEALRRYGHEAKLLDKNEVFETIHSNSFLGGLKSPATTALIDPYKLTVGLARHATTLGVEIFEHSRASEIKNFNNRMLVSVDTHSILTHRVVVATNVDTSLIRALKKYIVPIYDYILVTEPLSKGDLKSIGWEQRQGLAEASNQFHYFRLTSDNRILWGGFDAIYHYGSKVNAKYDSRPESTGRLADNFFETFPQLTHIKFSNAWSGTIDTCTRFAPFFGTKYGGKAAYALGFTGLGVGATRFAAKVIVDLLYDTRSPVLKMNYVKRKPLPFPVEPFRSIAIAITKQSLANADSNDGRENTWLRLISKIGFGFDS